MNELIFGMKLQHRALNRPIENYKKIFLLNIIYEDQFSCPLPHKMLNNMEIWTKEQKRLVIISGKLNSWTKTDYCYDGHAVHEVRYADPLREILGPWAERSRAPKKFENLYFLESLT